MKSIKQLLNNSAFVILLWATIMVGIAYAADKKLSALTNLGSAPAGTDELVLTDDPGGTPATKALTINNLFAFDNIQTLINDLDADGDGDFEDEDFTFTGTINMTGATLSIGPFDAGDSDITSMDKLEGVDAAVYIDMGADGIVEIEADGSIQLNGPTIVEDGQTITFDESAADPDDADVQLSAADGVFKIASANGANNEDLTIDTDGTANTATINSTTGVTSIVIAAGIDFDGEVPHYESTAATVTVSGNNGIYYNSDDDVIEFDLPAAAAGKQFCFHGYSYARAITIDPDDSDQILLDGALETAGEAIDSTGAANDFICLHGKSAGVWVAWGSNGTWDGAVD